MYSVVAIVEYNLHI